MPSPHSLDFFLLLFTFLPFTTPLCSNSPHLFLFGDSNSDTGNLAAGLGFPINPPNGRAFFNSSTGRLSDGRLVVDFLCSSLNTGFLAPYMESLGSDFRNGASFGVVGAGTLPVGVPFVLGVQVMQFGHFRRRSFELVAKGSSSAITDEGLRRALYMIDIGQNDLSDAFAKNMTYAQVVNRIPSVITEIQNTIKTLYAQGGRYFWVHNTGPLGCLPQKLWLVQTKAQKKAGGLDSDGCIASYNSAAKLFNEALLHLCQQMGSDLNDATIVYVDIYAIKHDIIANASKYGFSNPLIACCGFGGPPYNYNVRVTCGNPGAEACSDGSRFVSWDGVHYTEAANSVIAEKILSGDFSTPRTSFDFFCK
ncbi:hypothetical protein Droror1_Dr00024975 [Drosera rotundifolia]